MDLIGSQNTNYESDIYQTSNYVSDRYQSINYDSDKYQTSNYIFDRFQNTNYESGIVSTRRYHRATNLLSTSVRLPSTTYCKAPRVKCLVYLEYVS